MGLFDFLFSKKREEAERLERERIEAAERERRLIEENEAAARRLEAQEVRREARQQTRIQQASSVSSIQAEVDRIIQTYEARNIPQLQQYLFELYSKFNSPGGGRLITSYPQKDRLCEVFLLYLQGQAYPQRRPLQRGGLSLVRQRDQGTTRRIIEE